MTEPNVRNRASRRAPPARCRVAVLAWVVLAAAVLLAPFGGPDAPTAALAQDIDEDSELGQLQREFIDVCDKLRPSVVAVSGRNAPIGGGRVDGVEGGSGFVISDDGYILTSTLNVTDNDDTVSILFSTGDSVDATVVAREPKNAVALLKIDDAEEELFPVEFGDSEAVEPGQICMSFGNPYSSVLNDYEVAASLGTVSCVYRPDVPRQGNQRRFIGDYRGTILEHTCATNDGSWGGPLTDREGRVLGMVAKVVSYNSWLGAAVPIHQIELVLEYLKNGEAIPDVYHGMTLEDADDPDNTGAVKITDVDRGSPAKDAKIRDDDLILKVDGERLTSGVSQWDEILDILPAGSEIVLTLLRGRERLAIALTLELAEED